jgi:phospholipid/cholesterol/gamma-HCH transport system permease protein
MGNFFTFVGEMSHFGSKGLVDAFEWEFFVIQIEEIGWAVATPHLSGLALGIVLSMHTRGTLVQFGAEAMIPTLQSGLGLVQNRQSRCPGLPHSSSQIFQSTLL